MAELSMEERIGKWIRDAILLILGLLPFIFTRYTADIAFLRVAAAEIFFPSALLICLILRRNKTEGGTSFSYAALGVFAAAGLLSLVVNRAFFEARLELTRIASAMAAFACGATLLAGREHSRRFAAVLVIVGAASGLYGIFQSAGIDWVDWHFMSRDRIHAAFCNPNAMGTFLALSLPVATGFFLAARAPKQLTLTAAALMLICTGIVLTRTRAAWIAGFFAYAMMSVFVAKGKRRALLAVIPLLLVAIILIPRFGLGERLWSLADTQSLPVRFRAEVWRATLEACRDRPITGWGPGTYSKTLSRYRHFMPVLAVAPEKTSFTHLAHAHNEFLQVFCELGIVGLLAFVILLWSCLKHSYACLKRDSASPVDFGLWVGTGAILIDALFSSSLRMGIGYVYLWVCLGVMAGTRVVTAEPPRGRRAFRGNAGLIVLSAIVSLLCLKDVATRGKANVLLRRGLTAAKGENYSAACTWFNKSIAGFRSDKALMALGSARQEQGNYEKSFAAYEAVFQKHPEYVPALYKAGLVMKKSGNDDRALRLFMAAYKLDPFFTKSAWESSKIYVLSGRKEHAKRLLKEILILFPNSYKAHLLMGAIVKTQGDLDRAHFHYAEAYKNAPAAKKEKVREMMKGRESISF